MSRREVEAAASQSRKHQLAASRARLCARTGKTGRGGAMMIQAMIPDEERRTSLSGRMIPRPIQVRFHIDMTSSRRKIPAEGTRVTANHVRP
jgi:hypothetical protein